MKETIAKCHFGMGNEKSKGRVKVEEKGTWEK
jgi:hypothetical protein